MNSNIDKYPEMDIKKLKIDLQSYGVHCGKEISGGRASGAGPAGSMTFLIGRTQINAPFAEHTGKHSGYILEKDENGVFLKKRDSIVSEVKLISPPLFYGMATESGTSYKKIALLHGMDCLATTLIQKCDFWAQGSQCRFCAIEFSLANGATIAEKTPQDIAEVAAYAKLHDGVSHITLTSGSLNDHSSHINYLTESIHMIKDSSYLPVHIQIIPNNDLSSSLQKLRQAGADTIGIHIESFDERVREKMTPAKSLISVASFKDAWKESVSLFGKNQVSSFIITGIGESIQSVIEGSEMLAEIGVYPFVLPLHPIPGTEAFELGTPDPDYQDEIYRKVSAITNKYGLSSERSKAGCVRCSACSAMKEYEETLG